MQEVSRGLRGVSGGIREGALEALEGFRGFRAGFESFPGGFRGVSRGFREMSSSFKGFQWHFREFHEEFRGYPGGKAASGELWGFRGVSWEFYGGFVSRGGSPM